MEKRLAIILVLLAAIGISDTLIILSRSTLNIGNIMPGFFGLCLLLIVFFYPKIILFFQTPAGRYLKISCISAALFFTITFLLSVLAIQHQANASPENGADAIVVLGAGLNQDQVSLTLANRLDGAVSYFQQNPDVTIVVSGGQGPNELVTEAFAMKEYLKAKGVPAEKILMEEQSTNTVENFENSKKILDAYFSGSPYRIVFVTNDFHIFRSGMIAKDCGFDASGLACPSYLPMLPNFYFREYLSISKYYLVKIVHAVTT